MEGLRGLAVLLVYFVHAHSFFGGYLLSYPRLYRASAFLGLTGNSGVDLFFVLSGFIIYGALLQKPVSYASFLRRRVQRLYPTFLAVLSTYLVLSVLIPSESKIPTQIGSAVTYIIQNILLLPGVFAITPIITVAWSLSFEFAFYILVPLVVLALGRSEVERLRRIAILGLLWAALFLLLTLLAHGSHIRMLSFLSGMLLQEAVVSGLFRGRLTRIGQVLAAVCLIIAIGYRYAGHPGAFATPIYTALMSLCLFTFVFYTLDYRGALQKLFTWSPLRYWGNISYSYYLAHGITLKALAKILERFQFQDHLLVTYFSALLLGLIATWITGSALYLVVEKPFSLTSNNKRSAVTPARSNAELGLEACRPNSQPEVVGLG
jgi:exopolysaccharide production protein ExoZ